MTRDQWLWMQASVSLFAALARAMRNAEQEDELVPAEQAS
jgi:hypothetical protein